MELNRKNLFNVLNRAYRENKLIIPYKFFCVFKNTLNDFLDSKTDGFFKNYIYCSMLYSITAITKEKCEWKCSPYFINEFVENVNVVLMDAFADDIRNNFLAFMGDDFEIFERELIKAEKRKRLTYYTDFEAYLNSRHQQPPSQLIHYAFNWQNYNGIGMDWGRLHRDWYNFLFDMMRK